MRYLIRHVKCMRILFRHVKCLRYFNSPCKMYVILIRHVKCVTYFWPPKSAIVDIAWFCRCWSSISGLKSEQAVYFSADILCLLRRPDKPEIVMAKQLSTTTTPLCFGFFRCRVDVLQSLFSRNSISFAEFNVSTFLYFVWIWLIRSSYRSYFLRQIRLRSFCSSCLI